jgi:hypothetical protein
MLSPADLPERTKNLTVIVILIPLEEREKNLIHP